MAKRPTKEELKAISKKIEDGEASTIVGVLCGIVFFIYSIITITTRQSDAGSNAIDFSGIAAALVLAYIAWITTRIVFTYHYTLYLMRDLSRESSKDFKVFSIVQAAALIAQIIATLLGVWLVYIPVYPIIVYVVLGFIMMLATGSNKKNKK